MHGIDKNKHQSCATYKSSRVKSAGSDGKPRKPPITRRREAPKSGDRLIAQCAVGRPRFLFSKPLQIRRDRLTVGSRLPPSRRSVSGESERVMVIVQLVSCAALP